ncbi:MAG: YdhR family protein [Chloroflexi bacterium]|nr:YdhR family protein [Chloroflexota bacterium]
MTGPLVGLLSVFRSDGPLDAPALRELFRGRYSLFLGVPGLRFKAWFIDEAAREFGALYVFASRQALDAYLASDTWRVAIPQRFGQPPEVRVWEVPQVIAHQVVTAP